MYNRMERWFAYDHLPEHLQAVSREVHVLLDKMEEALDDSAEKSAGVRHLLEAKDCFVRAAIETKERQDAEVV